VASDNLFAVVDSRDARAFAAAAAAWSRDGDERALERLLRSPFSGVPHDVAAAYATLANRAGSLLEAIEAERLALPATDRDAALAFAQRARRARAGDEDAFPAEFPSGSSASAPHALALLDPAEPEGAAGVRARQGHFSASALNAFVECERKWFYRYVCAAVEDRGSSASAYGTAFHLALEDFHAVYPRPRASDQDAMRVRIVDDVRWAFLRNRDGFETEVEFELQLRRAQRTAQRYVDWLIAQEREAPFEVIGREVPAHLELGGHAFVGFIDRLDRNERGGTVRIVDYKTGSIATSAAEYREKVRSFRDFQLPFYYWARAGAGDRVSQLALVPLKDALLDVRPIALEVVPGEGGAPRRNAASGEIGIADLERARKRMIEICDRLAAGEMERFAVTTDPVACTYCAYAIACARKPEPLPEKFAR
jgi:RecB family exonuclease